MRINEVEQDGDSPDGIELVNDGNAAVDVSGLVVRGNADSASTVLSSIIEAGGFFVVDQPLPAGNPNMCMPSESGAQLDVWREVRKRGWGQRTTLNGNERTNSMLTLTDTATTVVKSIVEKAAQADAAGLRIHGDSADATNFNVAVVTAAEPGDAIVEADGARVFLEPNASRALDDKVLDAEVSDAGAVTFALTAR